MFLLIILLKIEQNHYDFNSLVTTRKYETGG